MSTPPFPLELEADRSPHLPLLPVLHGVYCCVRVCIALTVAPVAVGSKKVKKSADNINARLALVIKSGKYSLGYKSTVKAMRSGKSKLVLISGNTPPLRRSELEYYAMLSKTPVHLYQGSNVALGTAAGKLFRVGVMSIENAGDSDLLSVTSQ